MRELTYGDAVSEALREEMARDETVFSIGEDIGPVRDRKNLWDQFRERRIWQTPISESGFTGIAVGAAMSGLRPVAVIMYCDFVTVCMDPIVNQAAKIHLMSGGQIKVPMVIRTPGGGGTREAGHHSQSLESWFVHTPGLKVVMPSTPADAKGLMKSSIREDGPVVYIEHRLVRSIAQPVPDGEWLVPLVPLDVETIVQSVQKTGRLLVVHDAPSRGGMGAEIVRQVVEQGFEHFRAPAKVLGGLNTPMPYSAPLEDACIPQKEDIVEAIRALMRVP